jgi:hypothetical protein
MKLPFGQFRPDLPTLVADPKNESARTAKACNCVPGAAGYYPFFSFGIISDAADSRPLGAASARKDNGTIINVLGDAGKLYDASGTTLSDISAAGAYSILDDESGWYFTQFGNLLMATHLEEKLQSFDLSSGSAFVDHITSSLKPQGRYIATVGEFPVLAYTNESGTTYPRRVTWPSINDSADWERSPAKQSDYQDILDSGHITGITGNKGFGIVFTEEALHRMDYRGGQLIFQFSKVEGSKGTQVPRSVLSNGQSSFYYSPEGFMEYDGVQAHPIGSEAVDLYFAQDFDFSYRHRMTSAIDPYYKLAIWAYPGEGNVGGRPNKALLYRWDIQRWASLENINIELLFSVFAAGYTLEDLDDISASLDALPLSLDSGFFRDGRLTLAGVDGDYRVGAFNGSPMAATIDTQEINLAGGNKAYIESFRSDVVGGTVTAALVARDVTGSDADISASLSVYPATGLINCEDVPSARYHRFRLSVSGNFQHIQGISDIISTPDGIE